MSEHEIRAYFVRSWGRDYSRSGDGYDDMSNAQDEGWKVRPSWGVRGWDLGTWPYVAYLFRDQGGKFDLLEICEGDHSLWSFSSAEDRAAAVDYIFQRGDDWEYVARDIAAGEFTEDSWRGPYVHKAVTA